MTTTTSHRPTTHQPATHRPSVHRPAVRSKNDALAALPAALRSEWIKLSTIRSNKGILALTFALNGLMSWAIASFVTDEGELFVDGVFAFSTVFTAVFAAVAGILIFSSEAQHGTLAPTLTAQPSRLVIAAAKTLIASGFGAVLGAAGLIAGLAGALAGPIETGHTSTIVDTSLWAVLFVSLASILGLGIGMVARDSTAAISGLLVWWLVVENLLSVFVDARFSRFLPFVAGNGLLAFSDDGASIETLTRTEDALVFGAYAAVVLSIGTALLCRRDNN